MRKEECMMEQMQARGKEAFAPVDSVVPSLASAAPCWLHPSFCLQ